MSIQSEITRISGNVSDAFTAITNKGVTVPVGSTSDDLADLISQISGGGAGAFVHTVEQLPGGGDHHIITGVDISSDTVTAAHLETGYTAHDAEGNPITGTLSPGGGGGGLEYETGTWTPASDIADYTISFANTHTDAPFYYMISDETNSYSSTADATHEIVYSNFGQLFGYGYQVSTTQTQYGVAVRRCRNSSNSTSGTTGVITTPYTDTSSSANTNSRYWATESGIRAYYGSSNYYWLAGRTYKWIAVWPPTT